MKYGLFVDRIDIDALEEAIGFDPIESADGEDRGRCPDYWGLHAHGDRTGKFSINRKKRVFNCFVCGGGSLLSLAMAHLDTESPEKATQWIYQFTQAEYKSDEGFLEEIKGALDAEPGKQTSVMPYFNRRVLERWIHNDHPWFDERHIDPHVRRRFRLGYNPKATKPSPKGDFYEGPAIILPHFWKGGLVGWQTRWLDEKRPKWIPKYTNTPDFPKRETLFGMDDIGIQKVLIVESVPTALYLRSMGREAVATFGSSVTEEQLKHLRSLHQGVVVCPDNDGAGMKFDHIVTKYLERFIPVFRLPPVEGAGCDIGDVPPHQLGEFLERREPA